MQNPYLLHLFDSTKNVSPFDVNMGYEAGFDSVIPYSQVTLADIHAMTQDTIFSRGPKGVKHTAIFIGGREFGLAIDMLHSAKAAMVHPFEVSVFADPSGAITTASAILAYVESCLQQKAQQTLTGKKMTILGGTGPVGVCVGILAASCGANVYLMSRRGTNVSNEYAAEYNNRFNVTMQGCDGRDDEHIIQSIADAEIIINATKAGIQVLTERHLAEAKKLLVAADANAVPPAGIAGIKPNDQGLVMASTPQKALGIGALAIGDVKYKVHYQMFQTMKQTDAAQYLDHTSSFEVARTIFQNR